MSEMIHRASVDLALSNLAQGYRNAEARLAHAINGAWGQLVEARKAAKKNRDSLVEAAERNRRKKRQAAEADYNRQSRGPEGASYEALTQELAGIDTERDTEVEHDDEIFARDCAAAEDKFRTRTAEYREQFAKAVNTVVENFNSAHP